MIEVSDVLKIVKPVEYVPCCHLHLSECKREHYLLRICEGAGRKVLVTAMAAKGTKNTGLLVEVLTDVQDGNGGSPELEHAVATGDAIPAICKVA